MVYGWKQSGGHMKSTDTLRLNLTQLHEPSWKYQPLFRFTFTVLSGEWWSTLGFSLIWPHELLKFNWPHEMKGPFRVICNGCSYSRRVIVPLLVLTVEECNEMLCKFLRRWTFVLIRHSLSFMQRGWINNLRYITHTPHVYSHRILICA